MYGVFNIKVIPSNSGRLPKNGNNLYYFGEGRVAAFPDQQLIGRYPLLALEIFLNNICVFETALSTESQHFQSNVFLYFLLFLCVLIPF